MSAFKGLWTTVDQFLGYKPLMTNAAKIISASR